MLGSKQYVFVSQILVEELSQAELEAILRHEEFHVREPSNSLLASFLSLFIGGKNSLLAFYDYRASERAADDYAADKTSRTTVRRAIGRVYDIKADVVGLNNRIKIRHPGIIQPDDIGRVFERIKSGGNRIVNIFRIVWKSIIISYDLYFGSALLETAHLDRQKRIERLRDDDT
jgi:hypothetical protein